MSPELPPDRRLSDKNVRVDRILAETRPTDLAGRRRRRISYALAAAVVLIASALGIAFLNRPTGPEVSGSPPPTAAPTAADPTPADPTPPDLTSPEPSRSGEPDPNRLRVGDRVELDFFTITVSDTEQSSNGFAARVETCITDAPPRYEPDAIPISWYAWRADTADDTYQASVRDLADPAFKPVYPSGEEFAVGDCADGWIPFEAIDSRAEVVEVSYSNDYGGEARWLLG